MWKALSANVWVEKRTKYEPMHTGRLDCFETEILGGEQ